MNKKLSISIIGSRKAYKVGIETSYKLGKIFATKDYNVVSGLALGCDEYAHKGALSVKKILQQLCLVVLILYIQIKMKN